MKERWQRIEKRFSDKGIDPSTLFLPPATDEDFERLKSVTSLTLPAEAEAFYRIHNGQRAETVGVVFGLELFSIDRMIENWRVWQSISNNGLNAELADMMTSIPPGFIKPMYINLKWLPLTHDQGGNHIGIDFDPDSNGVFGQIIIFGRDDDAKKLFASTFADWIDMWMNELITLDWTLDAKSGWQIQDSERDEYHYHDWPRNELKT